MSDDDRQPARVILVGLSERTIRRLLEEEVYLRATPDEDVILYREDETDTGAVISVMDWQGNMTVKQLVAEAQKATLAAEA